MLTRRRAACLLDLGRPLRLPRVDAPVGPGRRSSLFAPTTGGYEEAGGDGTSRPDRQGTDSCDEARSPADHKIRHADDDEDAGQKNVQHDERATTHDELAPCPTRLKA